MKKLIFLFAALVVTLSGYGQRVIVTNDDCLLKLYDYNSTVYVPKAKIKVVAQGNNVGIYWGETQYFNYPYTAYVHPNGGSAIIVADSLNGYLNNNPCAGGGGIDTTNFWNVLGNSGTTAGTNFVGTTDAQDLVFGRNGSEAMRIYSSDKLVGIGTATPIYDLDVTKSASGAVGIQVANTNSVGVSNLVLGDGNSYSSIQRYGASYGTAALRRALDIYTLDAGDIRFGTSNTERMRILSTGNVGIGTTSPAAALQVVSTATTATTNAFSVGNPSINKFFNVNEYGRVSIGNLASMGTNYDGFHVRNLYDENYNSFILFEKYDGTDAFKMLGTGQAYFYNNLSTIDLTVNAGVAAPKIQGTVHVTCGSAAADASPFTAYTSGGSLVLGAFENGNVGIGKGAIADLPTAKLDVFRNTGGSSTLNVFNLGSDYGANLFNVNAIGQTNNYGKLYVNFGASPLSFGLGDNFAVHNGTDMNIKFGTYSGSNIIESINDAHNADVPMYLYASDMYLWNNVGVGYTSLPASTRFSVKGPGTTSATYSGLFEKSDGSDVLGIRDDGYIQFDTYGDLFGDGSLNLYLGINGFNPSISGNRNTILGNNDSGLPSISGAQNTIVGCFSSLSITGNYNAILGARQMGNVSSGTENVVLGGGFTDGTKSSSFTIGGQIAENNEAVFGSSVYGRRYHDWYFGAGKTGLTSEFSPTDLTWNITNRSGQTDVAAAYTNWVFKASAGTGTGTGGDFVWKTAPAGSTGSVTNTFVEKMRLTSLGKVGIGVATPSARLHVYKGGDAATDYTAYFMSSDNVGGAGGILFGQGSTYAYKMHSSGTGGTSAGLVFSMINASTGVASYDNIMYLTDGYVGFGAQPSISGNTGKVYIKGDNTGSTNYALNVINSGSSNLFNVRNDGAAAFGTTPLASTLVTIKGSGATSATYAMKVQNSASTDLLLVRDDGKIDAGLSSGSLSVGLSSGFGYGHNTFFGVAIHPNGTGTYNTAVGSYAMNGATSGGENTALGYSALRSITSSFYNVAIGSESMYKTTSGGYNTAVGTGALYENTTGAVNVAVGTNALRSNTTGIGNQAMGMGTLYANTTGQQNIAIGGSLSGSYPAMRYNTTGSQNIAIGVGSLGVNVSGDYNNAVGYEALGANTGGSNCAFGSSALGLKVGGSYNAAFGSAAMYGKTSGDQNSAFGVNAGRLNLTGDNNTFIGAYAGYSATGSTCVMLGFNAGYYETGNSKLFIDNASRSNEADGRKKALIYGGFGTDSSAQFLKVNGEIRFTKGMDGTQSDGATIQGQAGQFTKDATGTTFTLTNALINANSIILLTFASDPGAANHYAPWVVAGAGSATINFDSAPAANTKVNFLIINNN